MGPLARRLDEMARRGLLPVDPAIVGCRRNPPGIDAVDLLPMVRTRMTPRVMSGYMATKLTRPHKSKRKPFDEIIVPDSVFGAGARVVYIVATRYGFTTADITSGKLHRELIEARHMAMFIVRCVSGYSFAMVGALFGGRDHKTVVHACRKATERAKVDEEYAQELAALIVACAPKRKDRGGFEMTEQERAATLADESEDAEMIISPPNDRRDTTPKMPDDFAAAYAEAYPDRVSDYVADRVTVLANERQSTSIAVAANKSKEVLK